MNNRIIFFRYSGTKFPFIPELSEIVCNFDNDIYVEPFIGSGALLFNLPRDFKKYIINDIDRNIVRIYETFKYIDFEYYEEKVMLVEKTFGDIKRNKEAYYKFRDWFNLNYWNEDNIEEGIFLHILANSCINSMLRFGPNGMNQSFGGRFYKLNKNSFEHIQYILSKTVIYNCDYSVLIKKYPTALFFFDPPYFSQGSSYVDFTEIQIIDFLERIRNLDFIYTDIKNQYNENLFFQVKLREMVSTAPNSDKSKNGNIETIFCSKEIKTKMDEWV